MEKEQLLALDIGTSSVRAAIFDARAEMLPAALVKIERVVAMTADGGAEIDALEAFAQLEAAIGEALAKRTGRIAAVAASCFWHSLVGVDAEGNPTTPVYTWGETRPAAFVKRLRGELDEGEVRNRTGAPFHSSYWPAKLMWLRERDPESFGRTEKWLSFADFAALRLFGDAVTSVSMASGSGIFDIRRNDWDETLLRLLGIGRDRLPRLAGEDETFGSPRFEALAEAKWFPAIGDGAANNIGAGCTFRERAALMIGTSGAMRTAYRGDVPDKIPDGLWCYRIDRSRVIVGGALSDGGGLFRWLKQNLALGGSDDEIEAELERRFPDGHGLTFLPFLGGERSTGYHEEATGACLGLRAASDAVDIAQAALEAVAYRFAEIRDRLASLGGADRIVASGGALRESPIWTRIIADVLGCDLVLPATREASLRGAVLLALEHLGSGTAIEDRPVPSGRLFRFDPARAAVYAEARTRHRRFYDLLVAGAGDASH